jgi:hypothetical protein
LRKGSTAASLGQVLEKLQNLGALKLASLLLLGSKNSGELAESLHERRAFRGLRSNGRQGLFDEVESHADVDHGGFAITGLWLRC